jgi:hypothetical protein
MIQNPNSPRPKKARQMKNKIREGRWRAKSRALLIIFFDIKGIAHKEFALTVQTVNSAYYCEVLRQMHENVQKHRLMATKELAVASLQHTV